MAKRGGGKIAFAPSVGHLDSALYNKFPMYKERCFSHAFNFFQPMKTIGFFYIKIRR